MQVISFVKYIHVIISALLSRSYISYWSKIQRITLWYIDLQQMALYSISFLLYFSQRDRFYMQRKTHNMNLTYFHIENMKI